MHYQLDGVAKKVIVECVFALRDGPKLIATAGTRMAMCLGKAGAKTMTQLPCGVGLFVFFMQLRDF